ncbi:MAG: DM13 domain-containing protein [Woeseiaceae bacterium]
MKQITIATIAVLVLAGGWFFLSPLFIDKAVDEDFSFTLASGEFDMSKVMAMSEAERMSMKNEIMDAAANAPDAMAGETMPAESPVVVAQGQFVDADAIHKGSGRAAMYRLQDGSHAIRFEEFRTTNGPALVVYLAKHPDPQSAADVTDGGFVDLGKLKGNVGNQNYQIPVGTPIDEFNSVVIWCELFDVLFSPAALNRT